MADILIIEDSPLAAKMESYALKKAGHQCRVAGSGAVGLEMFEAERPDLTIVDYMLPDQNGLQLLQALLERDPDQLCIMVTGKGDENLAAEVIKKGAKDYVVKTEKFYEHLTHVVGQTLAADKTARELKDKRRQNARLQAQNELAHWMAHNFKNILSGAFGFLQLIDLEDPNQTDEKRARYLDEAFTSLDRAVGLIDQLSSLTDLSPAESLQTDLAGLVDLAFEKVVKTLKYNDERLAGIGFLNQTGHIPPIRIHQSEVELALINLLQNALEALEGAGTIKVEAEIVGETELVLRIEDDGRGMPRETLDRAFEPLFSTKGMVGVGLGLSLAQAALRRSGGKIIIESVPGQGTEAIISWPLTPEP